jgi:hypothetical protein
MCLMAVAIVVVVDVVDVDALVDCKADSIVSAAAAAAARQV